MLSRASALIDMPTGAVASNLNRQDVFSAVRQRFVQWLLKWMSSLKSADSSWHHLDPNSISSKQAWLWRPSDSQEDILLTEMSCTSSKWRATGCRLIPAERLSEWDPASMSSLENGSERREFPPWNILWNQRIRRQNMRNRSAGQPCLFQFEQHLSYIWKTLIRCLQWGLTAERMDPCTSEEPLKPNSTSSLDFQLRWRCMSSNRGSSFRSYRTWMERICFTHAVHWSSSLLDFR